MERTLAFGLRLTLRSVGGRMGPIRVDDPHMTFQYRPNWGLPSMEPPEQTGAPVFRFSRPIVELGETVRAVIVVLFPQMVARWRGEVHPGVVLPMYEGSRVVGDGSVQWVAETDLPINEQDDEGIREWLDGGEGPLLRVDIGTGSGTLRRVHGGWERTDDGGRLKEFRGIVWIGDQPGIRVRVLARDAMEAGALLDAEYGEGHVRTLWNENDANRPR